MATMLINSSQSSGHQIFRTSSNRRHIMRCRLSQRSATGVPLMSEVFACREFVGTVH